jgi:bifunctional UDP-N-acetylglucosamine pyrophosphorylase / glucosamine-1-phosphate N-acetyltransferase
MKSAALILAAGKGTRMKSETAKVMHPLEGRPMISYPMSAAREAGAERIGIVLGHRAEEVEGFLAGEENVSFIRQEEQLGTGHAVACAAEFLAGSDGPVLILCGDVPLLTSKTVRDLLEAHRRERATVTVLTAIVENPRGYGRIVKGKNGNVLRIVEEKDATEEERTIPEINSGTYCVDSPFLREAVTLLSTDNAQKEYYLTDIIGIAGKRGLACRSFSVGSPEEVLGVNDRVQLAEAARVIRRRTNESLMLSGVTLIDPAAAYIEPGVTIGTDTVVHPNAVIRGRTTIGSCCEIGPGAVIRDCTIGDGSIVKAGSVLEEALVGNSVAVGPMAHLRPGTELRDHVKIGNFVETKKAVLGEGSKASHLTYLGDAEIGRDVNIGCGTITCNYDGVRKHRTVIGDDVFIGSDVQLVAPVTVGRNSLVAAGTTVTTDVPPDSLAIARVPQVNKEGWRLKKTGMRDEG